MNEYVMFWGVKQKLHETTFKLGDYCKGPPKTVTSFGMKLLGFIWCKYIPINVVAYRDRKQTDLVVYRCVKGTILEKLHNAKTSIYPPRS